MQGCRSAAAGRATAEEAEQSGGIGAPMRSTERGAIDKTIGGVSTLGADAVIVEKWASAVRTHDPLSLVGRLLASSLRQQHPIVAAYI